jgi:hypothetical protein
MIEAEVVESMRLPEQRGWGTMKIAKEPGLARNTVRRYLRDGEAVKQRRLDEAARAEAVRLFDADAEGKAVVVQDLLAAKGDRGERPDRAARGRGEGAREARG